MLTRSRAKLLGSSVAEFHELQNSSVRSKRKSNMASTSKDEVTIGKPSQQITLGQSRLQQLEDDLGYSGLGSQSRDTEGETGRTEQAEQAEEKERSRVRFTLPSHKYHGLTSYTVSGSRDGLPPPAPFEGKVLEDGETWLQNFHLWSEIRQHNEPTRIQIFPYLLKGAARTWYETQKDSVRLDWENLCEAFLHRFIQKGPLHHDQVAKIFDKKQTDGLPVLDFLEKLQVEGHRCGFSEDLLISAAVKALKPEIRSFVLQQDVRDWETLCKMALIAESSVKPTDGVLQQIAADLKSLQKQLEENKSINAIEPNPQQASSSRQSWQTTQPARPPRRQNFAPRTFEPRAAQRMAGPRWQQPGQQAGAYQMQSPQNSTATGARYGPPPGWWGSNRSDSQNSQEFGRCYRCNRSHGPQQQCAAENKTCFLCSQPGHLKAACKAVLY